MNNYFGEQLERFRGEITKGGVAKIKELRIDIVSGKLCKPEKKRAVEYAIKEFEDSEKACQENTLLAKFGKIWRDPVWSGVIATLIAALLIWFVTSFRSF
jgi:hypothetical protein